MTIEELGNQYNDQWLALMEKIKRLRAEAESLCPERKRKVMKRLCSLMESAATCKQYAKKLTEYYQKENRE